MAINQVVLRIVTAGRAAEVLIALPDPSMQMLRIETMRCFGMSESEVDSRTLIQLQRPMAKKTYLELKQQIESLEAQAAAALKAEAAGVVDRVKEAIRTYGLTAADLFGTTRGAPRGRQAGTKSERDAKYGDGTGNIWVGRGPRPLWLRDQIAAGKSLADFDMQSQGGRKPEAASSPAPASSRKTASKKRGGKARFRNVDGTEWSGFGPKPAWLKAAIEAGKSIDDFRV